MRAVIIGGGPGGLYFALLLKKAHPEHQVCVYERNQADDTFGFGVVFSDETLDNLMKADGPSYSAITEQFSYWEDIDFHFHGEMIRSGGHGFCGTERKTLLMILQARCRALGVELHFGQEVAADQFPDADLIVAADGVNSPTRERYKEVFKPSIEHRSNHFIWLGSTAPSPAFSFHFTTNDHGVWDLCTYQYKQDMSTWVVEAPETTWAKAEPFLSTLDEAQTVAYLEDMWGHLLQGHRLIPNRSTWRRFPVVRNERWSHANIVLLGDALHTAHFSIGSGTKLAMEDAIQLFDALERTSTISDAVDAFEAGRREDVEKTQYAANVSAIWTENPRRYWRMHPLQACFSMLSRAKAITYDNLRLRDAGFVDRVDRWFAGTVRDQGFDIPQDQPPPPMFTPFKVANMVVENRVVVSPMNMYSAEPGGIPGDFHLTHLGGFALGGAGLIMAEMTAVSEAGRITPGCPGIYTGEQVAAWRRIADFIHRQSGSKFGLQLGHCGRKGSSQLGWHEMDHPLEEGNWPLFAASPLAFHDYMHLPAEITRAEMDRVCEDYARAAANAEAAGFDLLEVHAGHGYLLSGFISPLSNMRTDEYGGDLDRRMRFPLEVFDRVRAIWPAHKPLSVRISATDWAEGGITPEDSLAIAAEFRRHGADVIDVSAGQTSRWAQPVYGRMFQTQFSEKIRNELGLATIAVGAITTADQVNTIVAAGRADLCALGRMHLVNPRFTAQAAADYGVQSHNWPLPYLTGRDLAVRLSVRQQAATEALRLAARPKSHDERRAQELQAAE